MTSLRRLGQPVCLPRAKSWGWHGRRRPSSFRKVIKLNTSRNEIDAMEYVRSHTSIPVPKVFTVYEQPDCAIHILMEFVPDDGPGYANMTLDQTKAFGQEPTRYLQQL